MEISTEFTVEDGFLRVVVRGPWTTQNARHVIDETRRELDATQASRILFDLRDWLRPDSDMTRFLSGEYLAERMPVGVKMAAFTTPEAINKFGENAAVNRRAWFRIFPDENSALEWLSKANT